MGVPIKIKTGQEVSEAMKKVFKKQQPDNLHTDQGKEFFNKDFSRLTKEYGVHHYSTFSEKKASIVERVNRTLKNLMWREFNFRGNYRWIDILPDIVKQYNHTKHSTIRMKPAEVTRKDETKLLKTVYSKIKQVFKNKFKLDDVISNEYPNTEEYLIKMTPEKKHIKHMYEYPNTEEYSIKNTCRIGLQKYLS